MKKIVDYRRMIPNWYRVAYHLPAELAAVCYPWGIHWIVRLHRRIWERSMRYKKSEYENMIRDVRLKAYKEGFKEAYDEINDPDR